MSGNDDLLEESDATLQMDEAEVAKLHAALAAADVGVPVAAPAPTAAPAPAPAAAPAQPQPQVAPVHTGPISAGAPATAPGNGLLITGGIGAILLVLAAVCAALAVTQEFRREPGIMIAGFGAVGVGLILVGLGLIGATKRTNATATVTAVFAFISGIAFVLLLATMGDRGMRSAMEGFVYLAVFGLPLTLILLGAWALSAGKAIGSGLSVSTGITAILGGATIGGAFAMIIFRLSRRGLNDDGLVIAYFGGLALVAVSCILLTIIFFGPLKKAPAK